MTATAEPATVLDAVVRSRAGLLFATLIILLPLLPVFFLGQLGSALGSPLALSYALASGIPVALTFDTAEPLTFALIAF